MLLLIGKAAQRRSKRQWKNTEKEKRRKNIKNIISPLKGYYLPLTVLTQ